MRLLCLLFQVVAITALVAACGGGGSDPSPVPLTIQVQPVDVSVVEGHAASFSVEASGAGPLTYQWRRNGVPVPGANDKVYAIAAVTPADEGATFSVLVSNAQGSIASAVANLRVTNSSVAPSITVPPGDQSVHDGDVVTFSVTAGGTAPLAYEWQRNGVALTGHASAVLTWSATLADDGARFRVVVSNATGSVSSSEALLAVTTPPTAPTIVSHPSSTMVTTPAAATFGVTAAGTAPLSYQWLRNGAAIAGANTATYSTGPTALSDSGTVFNVVVSNAAGSATSDPATMTVEPAPIAPTITSQPADRSVVQGQTATFVVTATGTAPLTYQWRRNGVNITGANASTYTTPPMTVSADSGARYDVRVTNVAGSVASRSAMLTVTMPTTYLGSLLASVPEGGWVKANSNSFYEAWPKDADLPPPTPSGPYAVISAWSGFAWDIRRSNLILFGGGHANYVGNEVYVWRGADGRWTRGSLPSRVDLSTQLVEGNGAPQSAHTYQTNSYAPLQDRFVVFGGAIWSNGGSLFDTNGRTGPWWWDPGKADPDKVGGQSSTGWDPNRLGSNAWQSRPYVPWLGLSNEAGPSFVYGTSAYREESGKDVIYLTMDQNGSGWPNLYRYQLGTPGTPDLFQRVGTSSGFSIMQSGAAAIDSRNGLFVRTAQALNSGPFPSPGDLAVWRLASNNAANPELNVDVAVQLVDASGAPVDMNFASSIAYDVVNEQFVIWDGRDRGTVWITQSTFNSDGTVASVWTARRAPSTTTAQPLGSHHDGVLGKWKYMPEFGAFIALDSANTSGDVWLYKPPARP